MIREERVYGKRISVDMVGGKKRELSASEDKRKERWQDKV